MSCKSCGDSEAFDVNNPCKVCQLNDKDSALKKCKWCGTCKAYICEKHWEDSFFSMLTNPERVEAAVRNVAEEVVEFAQAATKKVKSWTGKKKDNDTSKTTA